MPCFGLSSQEAIGWVQSHRLANGGSFSSHGWSGVAVGVGVGVGCDRTVTVLFTLITFSLASVTVRTTEKEPLAKGSPGKNVWLKLSQFVPSMLPSLPTSQAQMYGGVPPLILALNLTGLPAVGSVGEKLKSTTRGC